MSGHGHVKSNFTAGELAPDLLGRVDLRLWDNGAACLRNVLVRPTGGITRRPGLRWLAVASGPGRLLSFEFNTALVFVLVLTDRKMTVFRPLPSGQEVQYIQALETPWTLEHLAAINWSQSSDTLLVVHPLVPPHKIVCHAEDSWSVTPWVFETGQGGVPKVPFARFAPLDVALRTDGGVTGEVHLHADKPFFTPAHVGGWIRLRGVPVKLLSRVTAQKMKARVEGTLPAAAYSTDWVEAVFSEARGWPVSVTFHQNRLVIGGSRDLPHHLWLSRVGDFFNFDPGQGLDDDALHMPILSDQVNAIRHVFPGRHLQVFTTGAEWMVLGEPLSPASILVRRQTGIGSLASRSIPPCDVDGATVFVAAGGRELRAFLFSDSEQAYQAQDLSLMASHRVEDPVDMDYDPRWRLLHMVMGAGTMATVTNYRREQITAWSVQETDGDILSVRVCGGLTCLLVRRGAVVCLECLDETAFTDCAQKRETRGAVASLGGLVALDNKQVYVAGADQGFVPATVRRGWVHLSHPLRSPDVGLPFSHVVEPLPPAVAGAGGGVYGRSIRLIRASFRVLGTGHLVVDTGSGPVPVDFCAAVPLSFRGDAEDDKAVCEVAVRALGWRTGHPRPLWRIEQDTPAPCTILSVLTDLRSAG
ncbi:hypothetical protein HEQ72_03485 [Haematospirillum sp. 15-248]|uniref:hypothetical protein n=1 Tax=Haematospirillum sp. 15-248 TaxID=2723107 RepID=UPI0014397BDA|nr:hypothetical protein [Haematospirillum sp. 15-248]NKD87376.1 hypothetical protein [Haematospirillum sp. 15-248]